MGDQAVSSVADSSPNESRTQIDNPAHQRLLAEDPNKKDDHTTSDQVAEIIGDFGRWQFVVVFAVQSMAYTSIAFHILVRYSDIRSYYYRNSRICMIFKIKST